MIPSSGLALAAGIVFSFLAYTGPIREAPACDGPHPSFRAVASTARRVLVGDVIDVKGRRSESSVFTLRVRHVLRGDAPPVMQFRNVVTQPCAGRITVRQGATIAVALLGYDFEPSRLVNAVAWVDEEPPPYPGLERLTLEDVFEAAGAELPDTATKDHEDPGAPVLKLLVTGLAAGLMGWRASVPVDDPAGAGRS